MSVKALNTAILALIQSHGYRINEDVKEVVESCVYKVIDISDELVEDATLASMTEDDDDEEDT